MTHPNLFANDALRTVAFTVIGRPAPQGSKRAFVVKGRPVLTESSKAVKPWREDVKHAAREAMQSREPLVGPIALAVTFFLPPPVSLSKANRALGPIRKPDLDKLLRSTMDAMSDAGVWRDDAQVVQIVACKAYPTLVPACGATIRVYSIDGWAAP